MRFENETIWLSQKLMLILFDCSTDNISLHLKNILKSGEINENSVTEDFSATASGKYQIIQDKLFESNFDKAVKS